MTGCAKVLFVNKHNEILLQLRTDKWSLFGGHIETDEEPERAAVREIKEELNYDLQFFSKLHEEVDSTGLRVWYFAYMEKSIDELELNEGDASGFFTYEQTKELPLTENTRRMVEKVFGWVDTQRFYGERQDLGLEA